MKSVIKLSCVLFLSGCASTAAPNFFNGQYYMAGDDSCKNMTVLTDTRIMCKDKEGVETGYRDAMTSEQITMWGQQQALQAQQAAATQASIRQNNEALAQQSKQILQQSQQFGIPQVNQPSLGTNSITYTQVGTSLIGSNGITYKAVGNSIIGSDGTTCQIVGSNIICN